MSRRRAAEKREVIPDAKFGDNVVAKFINCLMYQGKRVPPNPSSIRRSTRSSAAPTRTRSRCSTRRWTT